MLLKKARLSIVAIVFLVALRFLIGYHFYMEGVTKVKEGNFSAKGFLSAAKGPLASEFQGLIPDYDGQFRLPQLRSELGPEDQSPVGVDNNKVLTNKRLFEYLDQYLANVTELYGFNDEQKTEAQTVVNNVKERIATVVNESGDKISEYLKGFSRIARNNEDEMRNNVASMRKQKDEIEGKWKALAAPTLAEIDKQLLALEKDLNAIATSEQIGEPAKFAAFQLPGAGSIDVRLVDKYLPIFDMVVGILLMIGLLTPLAGIAAGLFLASVVLTQFPGAVGAQPTYYQAIEMVACFLLAFTDAGRYAGLDFIPWAFWNRNRAEVE